MCAHVKGEKRGPEKFIPMDKKLGECRVHCTGQGKLRFMNYRIKLEYTKDYYAHALVLVICSQKFLFNAHQATSPDREHV